MKLTERVAQWLAEKGSDTEVGELLGVFLGELLFRYGEADTRMILDTALAKTREVLAARGIELAP